MNVLKESSEIQEELLTAVSDEYEKTKGYFIWDFFKAVAICLKKLYEKLQLVANKLDVENLKDEELNLFVTQRTNISRKEAEFATGILTVEGTGNIKQGDLFETDNLLKFVSTENKSINKIGEIKIRAVVGGTIGNVEAKKITKIPITLNGIFKCYNNNVTSGGYDAESDESLRERYYQALQTPAVAGNIYHYKGWAREISGVGDVNVISCWNGNNTVKVVIVNDNKEVAESSLLDKVQNYIDPGKSGLGNGEAPIGAKCTVVSAQTLNINISVDIEVERDISSIEDDLKEQITEYFKSLIFKEMRLSIAKLGSIIINTNGVKDYDNLLINSSKENIFCSDEEIFVLDKLILNKM